MRWWKPWAVTAAPAFIQNSAYEKIREQNIWLPNDAATIDGGEFYTLLKAPSRIRDLASGELKYRWTETGALDHYRYAHAFDHLYGAFRRSFGVVEFLE